MLAPLMKKENNMTQEEKQLLLQDLCARLPYGVQGITEDGIVSPLITKGEADWDILTSLNYRIVKHGWKPYLRQLSSMTEEEVLEYLYIKYNKIKYKDNWKRIDVGKFHNIGIIPIEDYLDWLNSHHFDYRGLIEKGLALPAPDEMYR